MTTIIDMNVSREKENTNNKDKNAIINKDAQLKEFGNENRTNVHDNEKYKHLYLIVEHDDGRPIPVSLEMLGEARRLLDNFNSKYSLDEKLVAIILGNNVRELCKEIIAYGADVVIYAESQELKYPRNNIDTKVISEIARDKELVKKFSHNSESFVKPRYMFFAADSVGRHLSSTVLAELESGLASDINKLVVEDIEIKHEHKTKGQPVKYPKILEMYRPDFSGFLWTTILCLDNRNPNIQRDYHPQACSIIPGVFEPIKKDGNRNGIIINYHPIIKDNDLQVRILSRQIIKSPVDFNRRAIVSFGRGIKEYPEENIKLVEQLAKEIDAEIGVSLPISKRPYKISEPLALKYMNSDRVIGTSGRTVSPLLYIAIGISGAMQHIVGIKESDFIIAINPDEDSPIRNECDLFIKGRLEEVIPVLIEELKSQKMFMQISGRR